MSKCSTSLRYYLNNDPRHEKAFFVDGCAKHEDCKRHSLDGHESKYDPYDDIDESLLEINMNDSYWMLVIPKWASLLDRYNTNGGNFLTELSKSDGIAIWAFLGHQPNDLSLSQPGTRRK